jgi:hypothetical protein
MLKVHRAVHVVFDQSVARVCLALVEELREPFVSPHLLLNVGYLTRSLTGLYGDDAEHDQ